MAVMTLTASETSMTKVYESQAIEAILPHRYENVLVDRVLVHRGGDDIDGELETTLRLPDPKNRTLFAKQITDDLTTLIGPVYMEILALGSIVCLDPDPSMILIFAGISNYQFYNHYHWGSKITGKVKKTGERKGFVQCEGKLTAESGETIATGDIMAILVPVSSLSEASTSNEEKAFTSNLSFKPSWPAGVKEKNMWLCDELIYWNESKQEATFTYEYPKDHTCVRGHFPGNPIMMGVMQITLLEDSCYALAQYLGLTGENTINCSAKIEKKDGSLAASVKGASIGISIQNGITKDHSQMKSIKKVTFRGKVSPGEKLFITLNIKADSE